MCCVSLWPWVNHKLSIALLHDVFRVWEAALWHSFQLQLIVSLLGGLVSLHRFFFLIHIRWFLSDPRLWIFSTTKNNEIIYCISWSGEKFWQFLCTYPCKIDQILVMHMFTGSILICPWPSHKQYCSHSGLKNKATPAKHNNGMKISTISALLALFCSSTLKPFQSN